MLRPILFVAIAVFSLPILAQSAESLIQNMGKAFRETNYKGLLTYEHGSQIDSLSLIHAVIEGSEYEKLSTLDGEKVHYIRKGHELSCIHTGDQLLRLGYAMSFNDEVNSYGNRPNINSSYTIKDAGFARIANRDVRQINVVPKDSVRNGFRFFIDTETGLAIKSVVLSPEAKVLERFQFVQLDTDITVSINDFNVAENLTLTHDKKQLNPIITTDESVQLTPSWLPEGFVLSSDDHNHDGVKMLLYSDGFATLSIMFEKAHRNINMLNTDGRARRGSTVAYTRPVNIDGQKYVLTVLGEIPLFTAARIARHVAFRKAG